MTEKIKNKGVVWVSSYPKSGNTWLRFILTYLLSDKPSSSADIDAFIPEAMVVPGFKITIPSDQPTLLKTHWKMSMSLPLMEETIGFVYIVRNPMDIICSQFNFNRLRLNKDNKLLSDEELIRQQNLYIDAFIQHKGNPLVGHGGGNTSWVQNIIDWTEASKSYPSVIIRYEDMLDNPEQEITKIIDFFRLSRSKKEINNLIKKTSFKAMRRLEDEEIRNKKEGFFYHETLANAHKSGNRFMRKGKMGEGRILLKGEQLSRFIETFGGTMALLGYRINSKTGAVRLDDFNPPKSTKLPLLPAFGRATTHHQ